MANYDAYLYANSCAVSDGLPGHGKIAPSNRDLEFGHRSRRGGPMEVSPQYLRIKDGNKGWRSVCKKCCRTVDTAMTEAGLGDGEAKHKCPEPRAPTPYRLRK